jgi:hypothetical protein
MPSSVINHIAYDESRSELIVTFTTGKVYAYSLVPKRVYDEFRNSPRTGSFFNARIRNRYPARQRKFIAAASVLQDWNAALENLNKK